MAYGEVVDLTGTPTYIGFAAFTLVPHWDFRGYADNGHFGSGGKKSCKTVSGKSACVRIDWRSGWEMIGNGPPRRLGWMGSILVDKLDEGGLLYRRNRYVDAASGRFTQEDPAGLAGGVNLYGFADGDPVNTADPFGLDPCVSEGNCTQSQSFMRDPAELLPTMRNAFGFASPGAGANIAAYGVGEAMLRTQVDAYVQAGASRIGISINGTGGWRLYTADAGSFINVATVSLAVLVRSEAHGGGMATGLSNSGIGAVPFRVGIARGSISGVLQGGTDGSKYEFTGTGLQASLSAQWPFARKLPSWVRPTITTVTSCVDGGMCR
jgi:RHS repeat-associated protein